MVPPYVGGAPQGNWVALRQHLENILRYPHHFLLTGDVYQLWFLSSLLQGIGVVWVCLRFWNGRGALLGASYAGTRAGFQTHFDMKNGPFSSTLFVALGVWLTLAQPARGRVLAGIGVGSFGIYVLHVCVIECLLRLPVEGTFLQSPGVFAGVVLAMTWAAILLLGRVRGLRAFFL